MHKDTVILKTVHILSYALYVCVRTDLYMVNRSQMIFKFVFKHHTIHIYVNNKVPVFAQCGVQFLVMDNAIRFTRGTPFHSNAILTISGKHSAMPRFMNPPPFMCRCSRMNTSQNRNIQAESLMLYTQSTSTHTLVLA